MKALARHSQKHVLLFTILFVAAYFLARALLEQRLAAPLAVVAALIPVPVFALWLLSITRSIGQMDELERRIQLEAVALAFPLAMLLLMTLGLLELAVDLSPDDWSYRHVWAFLPLFYFIGLAIARRRYYP